MQKLEIKEMLYLQPIIGRRQWKLAMVPNSLMNPFVGSLVNNTIWTPKVKLHALCNVSIKETPPHINCTKCGIFSYKNSCYYFRGGAIEGRIYQWGKIIEHEYGHRSEYAYPSSFDYLICGYCNEYINGKLAIFNRFSRILCDQCANKYYLDIEPELDLHFIQAGKLLYDLNDTYGLL